MPFEFPQPGPTRTWQEWAYRVVRALVRFDRAAQAEARALEAQRWFFG